MKPPRIDDDVPNARACEERTLALWEAVGLNPKNIATCRALVCEAERTGSPEEAAAAWLALGAALLAAMEYREAVFAYGRVISHRPNNLKALIALGLSCLALGEGESAKKWLESALEIAPDHQDAHVYLGYAHHLIGEVDRGWDEFAWAYRDRRRRYDHEQPLWDGSPLNGRRILVWAEQGRGDTIQFLRYARFIKERGGILIVECHHDGLIPLIRRMPEVHQVVRIGTPLPPFDVHAPLIYFPALFPESRGRFNEVPYLTADPELVEKWSRRLDPKDEFTVGLSWAGNEAHPGAGSRFISLSAFLPLASIPRLRLISLQHGPRAADLVSLPPHMRVEQLWQSTFSIDDAAALVMSLDLIITVDTMIGHLAGALGKQVLMLLRPAANWRWQLDGDTTSWYNSMRLVRKSRQGGWTRVVEDVYQLILRRPKWQQLP